MNFGVTGETYSGDDPLIGMAFSMMSAGIVRSIERYEKRCKANEENIKRRWQKTDTNEYDGIRTDTNEYEQRGTGTDTVVGTGTDIGTGTDNVVFVFGKPTLEEVREFCQTTKTTISPERFYHYYQSRGWQLRPGQPMEDWKAALKVWEDNERKGAMNNVGNGTQGNNPSGNDGRYRTDEEVRIDTTHYMGSI